MAGIRHADGKNWWIVSHMDGTDKFYLWKTDQQGNLTQSSQAAGEAHGGVLQNYYSPIVFNEQGNRFALSYDRGKLEIFDFDRCSGEITPFAKIEQQPYNLRPFFGISFSPNGRFLYLSDRYAWNTEYVYQYDLQATDIQGSETSIGQLLGNDSLGLVGHKLGPDGRIYIGYEDLNGFPNFTRSSKLAVIENPNQPGLSCNFNPQGFDISPGAGVNFPNIPNYRLGPLSVQTANAGPDQEYCLNGTPVTLGVPDTSNGTVTFRWYTNTGTPASSTLSDTTAAQPQASPSDTTTYILETIDQTLGPSCGTTTDTVTVFPVQSQPLAAGVDQTLCREIESAEIGPRSGDEWKYICRWECDRGYAALLQTLDPPEAGGNCRPVATPYATTTYVLYSTDTTIGASCPELSDAVTLTVEVCDLEIPNVLTPNGDGVNDVWRIRHLPEQTKVAVFDRWGGEVFSSQNYGNDWAPAVTLPDGVYYYVVMPPKAPRFAGSLTIIR